jgi:hypothetical protein
MLIEGISVQVNGSVQKAIDQAGATYRRKYGVAPTHVSLPGYIAPDALKLYTLKLGRNTCEGRTRTRHSGTVIVGRKHG